MTTPSGAWTPFMVLEWLEGRSLADDLTERRSRGLSGRTVDEALAILEPAAAGLAVAHERNVVHRDIKPANLFLVNDASRVKVLDFGVAKIMKTGEESGTKGTFASFTWYYATPEQLDPRYGRSGLATDVYAFALVLTELLTDRQPMEARDPVAIMKAATDPTLRPTPRARGARNVPDAIEGACRRALAVDPSARFPSIKEFWAMLALARASSSSAVTQAIVTTTGAMPARESRGVTVPTRVRPPPASTPRNVHAIRTPAPTPVPNPPQGRSPPMGTPPPGTHLATGPFPEQPPRPRAAPPSGGAALVIVTVIVFLVASIFAATCVLTAKP
jgi:serine/threonine-protein kinase